MTNSSVNMSHFQHVQHCCYSQHCKSHRNDSTARVFPVRCQTSVSHCEQNRPSWLTGCVLNPEIALLAMLAGTLRAAGCKDGIRLRAQITPLECLSVGGAHMYGRCYAERPRGNDMTVRKIKHALPPPFMRPLSNRVANVVGKPGGGLITGRSSGQLPSWHLSLVRAADSHALSRTGLRGTFHGWWAASKNTNAERNQ